jgi:hypothetical protein
MRRLTFDGRIRFVLSLSLVINTVIFVMIDKCCSWFESNNNRSSILKLYE